MFGEYENEYCKLKREYQEMCDHYEGLLEVEERCVGIDRVFNAIAWAAVLSKIRGIYAIEMRIETTNIDSPETISILGDTCAALGIVCDKDEIVPLIITEEQEEFNRVLRRYRGGTAADQPLADPYGTGAGKP